jgi:hypothetical protein
MPDVPCVLWLAPIWCLVSRLTHSGMGRCPVVRLSVLQKWHACGRACALGHLMVTVRMAAHFHTADLCYRTRTAAWISWMLLQHLVATLCMCMCMCMYIECVQWLMACVYG